MEEEEWLNIVKRLKQKEKSLFIAEYNAFASPTKKEVRKASLIIWALVGRDG